MVRLESYRSIYGLVSKHVKDERLRFVLSFHPLFVGGNPFNVTSIYGLIAFLERRWGVHFAMGGTGSLVRGLVGLIEGQGNVVRYREEVRAITVKGRNGRPACGSPRAKRSRRMWSCRTPTRRGPIATCCRRKCAGAGPTGASTARATR